MAACALVSSSDADNSASPNTHMSTTGSNLHYHYHTDPLLLLNAAAPPLPPPPAAAAFPHPNSLLQLQQQQYYNSISGARMVRKRMASEMEAAHVTSAGAGGDAYFRFSQRGGANPNGLDGDSVQSFQSHTPNTAITLPNHSTTTAATSLTATSPCSATRSSSAAVATPVASSAGNMDDGSTATWVDGIIKDLIHSSSNVSIPQLIQNVRDIIYPCNPSLASVLEFRLRSLTEPVASAASILPRQRQYNQFGSSSLRLNLDSTALDSIPYHSDLAAYLNYPVPLPSTAPAVPRLDERPVPPPEPQPEPLPRHQQQPQQQAPESEPEKSSPSAEAASSADNGTGATSAAAAAAAAAAALAREKEEKKQKKKDEEGLHLLTLLLQCAEAVSADNLEEANRMLLEISELSTPYGTSAQRVAAYFSEAISARLVSSCLGIYASLPAAPHSHKISSAFQVFNGISPLVKFSHFTANQAIQEAFEREDRVHIIDLDIMQGLQWPGLFHILASRPGGPPHVRLTGLGNSMEALEATGKRLAEFADKLGLPFEFCPVAEKVGNLDPERLNVSKREAVAVHWLQHSLYDVTGSDTSTLWLLQR
ncbi:hypothetical protein CRG98_034952 [Punica granatum]|uniref:Uncharacterized protein n=1 Tax=Punica granatum TaxID=22663 RepID=A0A2I0IKS8_PUNGR|nr:hypothetical protein CRG98_034952 [Punica granatum]